MQYICICSQSTGMVDVCFRILWYLLLEEVCLALKWVHVHEVKWVGDVIDFLVTGSHKQTVSNKLNVLVHEVWVHANQLAWWRNSLMKTTMYLWGTPAQWRQHQWWCVCPYQDVPNAWGDWIINKRNQCAYPHVATDEFVWEGQPKDQSTLLEPENRSEWSWKRRCPY